MAYKQSEIIKNAKDMINGKFYYIYGMKGATITSATVNSLASLYPSVFTQKIKNLALGKVGKGNGIDCSGFVCRASGVSSMGSSQIHSSSANKWTINNLANLKNAMYIWRNGHIALIEIDITGKMWILEAQSTEKDLKRTAFETRYKSFTHYGEIKGVEYTDKPKFTLASPSKDWVKRLQTALNKLGYKDSNKNKLIEDGLVGAKTKSACRALKNGMKNELVILAQERLKELGFDCGKADGIFGAKTSNAVIEMKKKVMGAKKPTDVLGNLSWDVLLGVYRK